MPFTPIVQLSREVWFNGTRVATDVDRVWADDLIFLLRGKVCEVLTLDWQRVRSVVLATSSVVSINSHRLTRLCYRCSDDTAYTLDLTTPSTQYKYTQVKAMWRNGFELMVVGGGGLYRLSSVELFELVEMLNPRLSEPLGFESLVCDKSGILASGKRIAGGVRQCGYGTEGPIVITTGGEVLQATLTGKYVRAASGCVAVVLGVSSHEDEVITCPVIESGDVLYTNVTLGTDELEKLVGWSN